MENFISLPFRKLNSQRVKTHLINVFFFFFFFYFLLLLSWLKVFAPTDRGSGAEYIGIIFMSFILDFTYKM